VAPERFLAGLHLGARRAAGRGPGL